MLLHGCATADLTQDQPAIIPNPSAESRAAIQQILRYIFGDDIALADNVFGQHNQLVIERQRRRDLQHGLLLGADMSVSVEKFLLVVRNNQCVLIRATDNTRYHLPDVRCVPLNTIKSIHL